MAGRKILNEQDARRCLVAARGDPGWARAHDIDGRSLNAWRVNLGRRGRQAPRRRRATGVVELVAAVPAIAPARYVLHVRELRLELGDDFHEHTLRRLVGLLRGC